MKDMHYAKHGDPGPYSPSTGKTVNQVHSSAGTLGEDKGLRMNKKACAEMEGGSKGGGNSKKMSY